MLDLALVQKLSGMRPFYASLIPMHSAYATHTEHARLCMAAWHTLDQPPPPTVREILGAYRSKGDGDRDMLLAMLNAKSAEDQRLAAVASLHRTLLEVSLADARSVSPPPRLPLPSTYASPYHRHPTELANGHPSSRDPLYQSQPPRKRQRSSRSPPLSHHDVRSSHTSSRDLPPSPYSSRSDSEEYSPRSRASMAIGSLLSSDTTREDDEPTHARLP